MAAALHTAACDIYSELFGMAGWGMSVRGEPLESSDASCAGLETWQFVLGEGPQHDAFAAGQPVAVWDEASRVTRWPLLEPQLATAGVTGLFAYPMLFGPACIGAVVFYRCHDAQELASQRACGLACATLTATSLVDRFRKLGRTGGAATSGMAMAQRAAGMLMAQCNISADEALLRIRAHCYASDRLLDEVASDILDGSLHLPA